MHSLNSISQRQITEIRKLGQRKYRDTYNKFIAEGDRSIRQIIENGIVHVEYLVVTELYDTATVPSDIPTCVAPAAVVNELSDTENPQGILAVCKKPQAVPLNTFLPQTGILVACDRIQDPGNLGTIYRSSVWFGAKGILLGTGTADVFHPKVVRSTAGATGILPCVEGDLIPLLHELQKYGWQVCLLDASSDSKPIRQVNEVGRRILVVGNEGSGIHPDLISEKFEKVRIPGDQHIVESLNAGVALSVALYQFSI